MKKYFAFSAILASIILASCSQTTEPVQNPNPNPNQNSDTVRVDSTTVKRTYNTTRHGVQITALYFHQTWNKALFGLEDEWIILEADGNVVTKGWKLNANDPGQNFPLPDTIYQKLYIYTQDGPGFENDTVKVLGKGVGIWNNTDPDIARIFNEKNELVDSVTYQAKR